MGITRTGAVGAAIPRLAILQYVTTELTVLSDPPQELFHW